MHQPTSSDEPVAYFNSNPNPYAVQTDPFAGVSKKAVQLLPVSKFRPASSILKCVLLVTGKFVCSRKHCFGKLVFF